MDKETIRRFREHIRHFERGLNLQNNSNCCGGVTLAQCHTLLEIFSHGSINLSELSGKLYLDKSTVSRTVEGLVGNGLINRSIPRENRRTVIISLTEAGKNTCREIHRENDAYFGDMLEAVPGKDLPVFLKSFELLVKKMTERSHEYQDSC